jgi:16S rRNA (guanine527-N7)-methyltransferase
MPLNGRACEDGNKECRQGAFVRTALQARERDIRLVSGPDDFAALFGASREAVERLVLYEKLLRQWQKAVNLVAPGTLGAVWHRHFADSAQLVPLAPPGTRSWIDLGSGAGFPGLVVAILLAWPAAPSPRPSPASPHTPTGRGEGRGEGQGHAPTLQPVAAPHPNPLPASGERGHPRVTLIESDTRKCAFLREVARQVGVAVDILSTRAESARTLLNEGLPRVVSARALAPLDKLLGLAAPLSPPGTTLLLMKGREARKELHMAEAGWTFEVKLVPSVTDKHGRIAVVTNLKPKAKD